MYKRNLREINEIKAKKDPILVVGLTGGIASGKTTATDALKAVGFSVIDADEISRALFGKGDGERLLAELFPQASSFGAVDRAKLRRIISQNADARKKLNAATHPEIVKEIERRIAEKKSEGKIVLSAPLLFESGLSALCDCTVCVTCPTRIRIERLCERDNVEAADAKAMIDAQIPDAYRATLADFCIPSDRDTQSFRAEVVELFQALFDVKNP